MASRKFRRKIEEVAAQVMDDGEQFVAGVVGVGADETGDTFSALGIVTDRNVYLIRTPPLKPYEVKDVVLKRPVGSAEVRWERSRGWPGVGRLEIDDYRMSCTYRIRKDAERFAEVASQTAH